MDTPRFLLFGLPPPSHTHTYLPSREQNFHPEVFHFGCRASLGYHGYIPVSKPRGFFSPLLTDAVIGLLLNVTYQMACFFFFFYLMCLMELIIPSPREIPPKTFSVTIINFFPKRLSRNQSINQSLYLCQYVVGWGCADHPSRRLMCGTYI